MRKLLILTSFVCGVVCHQASAQELNTNYRLTTAGCSLPNYPYTPDEQSFINAIEHVGPYPWTTDVVRFISSTEGAWVSNFIFDSMTECETTQEFTWSLDHNQKIQFNFKPSSQKGKTGSGNTTISCGDKDASQENYKFTSTQKNKFELSFSGSDRCGDYSLYFEKER